MAATIATYEQNLHDIYEDKASHDFHSNGQCLKYIPIAFYSKFALKYSIFLFFFCCRKHPLQPGGHHEGIHSLKLPGWDVPSQTLPGGDPPHVCLVMSKIYKMREKFTV